MTSECWDLLVSNSSIVSIVDKIINDGELPESSWAL